MRLLFLPFLAARFLLDFGLVKAPFIIISLTAIIRVATSFYSRWEPLMRRGKKMIVLRRDMFIVSSFKVRTLILLQKAVRVLPQGNTSKSSRGEALRYNTIFLTDLHFQAGCFLRASCACSLLRCLSIGTISFLPWAPNLSSGSRLWIEIPGNKAIANSLEIAWARFTMSNRSQFTVTSMSSHLISAITPNVSTKNVCSLSFKTEFQPRIRTPCIGLRYSNLLRSSRPFMRGYFGWLLEASTIADETCKE